MSKRILLGLSTILLCSNFMYSMDYSGSASDPELDTLSTQEIITDSDGYELVAPLTEEEKRDYVCEGRSWDEMMAAYEDAPRRVKSFVAHLQKPIIHSCRASFFAGPPGAGKSTAALAVPHLAGWYIDYICAPELLSKYRNETKERLMARLTGAIKLTQLKKNVLVIIDEVNRLLENFDSENHDADATASCLWTFLDRHAKNNHFFLIGTLNRTDKLPDTVIQRLGTGIVHFPPIAREKLLQKLKDIMTSMPDLELDATCDDAFINQCIEIMLSEEISITPRDFKKVFEEIAFLAYEDNPDSRVRKINCTHIKQAVIKLMETYNNASYRQEVLTEQEWREFNAIQSRIIDIKLQFSQLNQIGASIGGGCTLFGGSSQSSMNISRPQTLDVDKVEEILEKEFSTHQKQLYKRVMKRDFLISPDYVSQNQTYTTKTFNLMKNLANMFNPMK